MLHRQSLRYLRANAAPLALAFGLGFPGLLLAQNQTPAIPSPTPVPPSSLPSMPTPTKAGQQQQALPPPAQPAQQTPPPQPSPNPPQPAPAAQTLDQPNPQNANPNANPSKNQQNYKSPLDQPVVVQPAEPAAAAPVTMPAPVTVASLPSISTDYVEPVRTRQEHLGSIFIPDDNAVYPMALRLYSLGYLDTSFISMRPWTRRSLLHSLEQAGPAIQADGNEQALEIYAKLMDYLHTEIPGPAGTTTAEMTRGYVYGVESVYGRAMGITGLTLRDSYHLGQTIVNDYARPYEPGFNAIAGFSTMAEKGRFSFYLRGEYQHSPSAVGYNYALASELSCGDEICPFAPPNLPQDTIPYGPISSVNTFRLQEAYLSFHFIGHEISGGKSDAWLGPGAGGAMAWSNNAENIYSFRIDRVEPLHIPYFTYLFGGLRYDFFVGSLKGHTFPNSPWVHSEMFSLRPTDNFEFSFQRTVIWGGEGHVPVTLHTFLRSFFSLKDTETDPNDKNSSQDPGARYSDFSFSYRLPFLRKYVTLYTDSIAHDDVTPISAPRRAAYRPGVYISQFPGLPRLDFRIEGANTDCSTLRCTGGVFNYFEAIQRQGYTNKGFIMGDWVGREAKAGQAWLTYHLSANEWVQAEYLYKKTPKDFIRDGTTQNQFKIEVVKRLHPNVELDAWFQYEHWIAPIYKADHQNDTVTAFQVTFYPKLRSSKSLNGK